MKSLAEGSLVADNESQSLVKESGKAVHLGLQRLLDAISAQSKADENGYV